MAELAQQIPWASTGWEDSDDFQDQLLGLLGILGVVGEGMEAVEASGDGESREWRRAAKIRQKSRLKQEIKSTAVETEKGYKKKEEAVTGRGNEEQTGRIKGESGWRLSSLNKHPIN